MKELLRGVYDLHVHTAPDVSPRKCDDLELARRLEKTGMAGCAIKSHFADTAGRAAVLRSLFPKLDIVGGITLNRSVGGINPQAVERTAQMGGKMLWFPTLEARSYQQYRHSNDGMDVSQFLSVFSDDGNLLPEVYQVLEIAAEYNMVVGTGHLSSREGLAVVRAARECGVEHVVLTHADNPANEYSLEEQYQAVQEGAMVEHCYFTSYYQRTPIEVIAQQIQHVGCKSVVLSTDFGQVNSPYSDEGMLEYMQCLLQCGISEEDLFQMVCANPRRLLRS